MSKNPAIDTDSRRTGRATSLVAEPISLAPSDDTASLADGSNTEDKGNRISGDASDFCGGAADGISGT